MKFRVIVALFCLLFASRPAVAESRVALVIANGGYGADMGMLPNPVNDGKLMAQSLKNIGFKVTLVTDGDQKAMKRAISDFGRMLTGAGPASTGLFYYAGHGIQVGGTNYLVPIGAAIRSEADVDLEAVAADTVLGQMEFSGAQVSIVILDACRNNPLSRGFRSATRGLARMDAPTGSFVAYSTAPGSVAADGTGANSPFATSLAAELTKSGQSIEETFRNVRGSVMAATNKEQVPWDSSSLTAPFYFTAPTVGAAAAGQQGLATVAKANDALFWQSIKDSKRPADFEAYLEKFPDGDFAYLAKSRAGGLAAALPAPDTAEVTRLATNGNLLPGNSFKDCPDCPEMVVVPAGSFVMGSPPGEYARFENEGPQHIVTIERPFAVGKFEITIGEFRAFVEATGRNMSGSCAINLNDTDYDWPMVPGYDWKNPHYDGYAQGDRDPVTCVSWDDAKGYVKWLSKHSHRQYRLLTESEWEYAARAGSTTAYPWDEDDSWKHKNNKDGDPYEFTAPVGSFEPNKFGLHDMLGNLWEWVEDCYHDSYAGAPGDGSAAGRNCDERAKRGGY